MKLLYGLHVDWVRRLVFDRFSPDTAVTSAHTFHALCWLPGEEGDDEAELWRANTEIVYREWLARKLTRGQVA